MIIVDASALVAILLDEPEAGAFRERLLASSDNRLSPVGYWEASTRLRGLRGDGGVDELNILIGQLVIRIAPATDVTARYAREAERIYGKRSKAKLNLGDCFAYALAREVDAPLLYKGADFAATDVEPAV